VTGNELLVLVPWLLFLGSLVVIVVALRHRRPDAGQEPPPSTGSGSGRPGRYDPGNGDDVPHPPAGGNGAGRH
jgi:hypothetical protein